MYRMTVGILLLVGCSDGTLDTGPYPVTLNPSDDGDSATGSDTSAGTDTQEGDVDTETESESDSLECGAAGVRVWDLCWYMGDFNQDCLDICEMRGGYFEGTPAYIGTAEEGGSKENCEMLLQLLGYSPDRVLSIDLEMTDWPAGMGCYWDSIYKNYYYTTNPSFDSEDNFFNGRRVCACGGVLE